jgi:hypothetical protein
MEALGTFFEATVMTSASWPVASITALDLTNMGSTWRPAIWTALHCMQTPSTLSGFSRNITSSTVTPSKTLAPGVYGAGRQLRYHLGGVDHVYAVAHRGQPATSLPEHLIGWLA